MIAHTAHTHWVGRLPPIHIGSGESGFDRCAPVPLANLSCVQQTVRLQGEVAELGEAFILGNVTQFPISKLPANRQQRLQTRSVEVKQSFEFKG